MKVTCTSPHYRISTKINDYQKKATKKGRAISDPTYYENVTHLYQPSLIKFCIGLWNHKDERGMEAYVRRYESNKLSPSML